MGIGKTYEGNLDSPNSYGNPILRSLLIKGALMDVQGRGAEWPNLRARLSEKGQESNNAGSFA